MLSIFELHPPGSLFSLEGNLVSRRHNRSGEGEVLVQPNRQYMLDLVCDVLTLPDQKGRKSSVNVSRVTGCTSPYVSSTRRFSGTHWSQVGHPGETDVLKGMCVYDRRKELGYR